jgi:hypothetical protein
MTIKEAGTDLTARPGEELVASRCWSCGTRLVKSVRLLRGPRHVGWSCGPCEVSWSERTAGRPASP